MTAKQVLDAFSGTLMQDERILSSRERELLKSLLQNSKAICSDNPEVQTAVNQAIARSVGETVAQRAFAVLGGSIVQQILASGAPLAGEEKQASTSILAKAPQPPQGPVPPSPVPPEREEPMPPQPPGPQPPGISARHRHTRLEPSHQPRHESAGGVSVMDAEPIRQRCVVLDEFLAPQELDELVRFALDREGDFQSSEVISPAGEPGTIDHSHRRSRVLMDLGKHEQIILDRVRRVLPRVLDQLGLEEFPVTHAEVQITASNDGDFFRAHCDDSQDSIASRSITFVYFFHREPRPFEGGELRIYDLPWKEQRLIGGAYRSIVPQQNQIVFFPCSLLHEITPVECPSQAFADSRFTLNGWLHR
jgi:2OG-Fe(II) oxygenase superfamily